MRFRLSSPDEIDRATRRPLVLAAALASAVLCPLVDELVLGGIGFLDGGPPPGAELSFYASWGALAGAMLGGLAMHLGLRRGAHPALLLATCAAGGFLYVPALLAPQFLISPPHDFAALTLAPVVVTLFGGIVSVPAGLGFGVLFGLAAWVARPAVERPTHASPGRGALAATLLALGASIAATVLGDLCFPALRSAIDAFATRHGLPALAAHVSLTAAAVVVGPLALATLLFAARALWLRLDVARIRRALAADAHPRWCLTEASDEELASALPLTAADCEARTALREREAPAPYRGARSPVLARVARA